MNSEDMLRSCDNGRAISTSETVLHCVRLPDTMVWVRSSRHVPGSARAMALFILKLFGANELVPETALLCVVDLLTRMS